MPFFSCNFLVFLVKNAVFKTDAVVWAKQRSQTEMMLN